MLGQRLMIVGAALFVLVMTGLTAAPPVWASGISPMGFLLALLLVALYEPGILPAWLIALLSLLQDAAVGAPYGFHGMVALLAVWLIERHARSYQRQSPWFVWAVLAAYLLGTQLIAYVLGGMFGLPVSMQSGGFSWLATLPFIPVLQWVMARITRVHSAV